MHYLFFNTLAFLNLGGGEVFVIAIVILLFFGSKQLPELAKGIGKGMREVKDAMNGVQSEIKKEMEKSESEINVVKELKDTLGEDKK